MKRAIALVALFALAACARQGPPPYAERYAAALDRYPGVEQPTATQVAAFVAFFSSHDRQDAPPAEDLYAQDLYFSDTLLTTERHERVIAHLERMREGAGELSVDVLDQVVDGPDVYLIWRMHATFTPVRKSVESDTIGMTHLRFDEDGRIVLQQDFWDSAEGFYRHLPVVGALVGTVAGRFADDP